METDDRYRWWTSLTFYGNDRNFKYNGDVCQLIRKFHEDISDLESYSLSNESYESEKEKTIDYYNLPLTKKEFPKLSREERIKNILNISRNMGISN